MLGHSISAPTGQLRAASNHLVDPVWSALDEEWTGHETRLLADEELPPHIRFMTLATRVRLACFLLQTPVTGPHRARTASRMFSSCIAAIELAGSLDPGTILYWPRSAVYSMKPITVSLLSGELSP